MRRTTIKILILCAVLICTAAAVFGIAQSFASGESGIDGVSVNDVREVREYSAGTNAFSISQPLPTITSGAAASFTVSNDSQNADDTDSGGSFDLVIVPTGGFDIDGAAVSYGQNRTGEIKDGIIILSDIALAPSANNTSVSTNVSVTITAAEGVIAEGESGGLTYKAYAVRHSENNRFVGDQFRFKSVMDEYFHQVGENNTAVSPSDAYSETYDLLYIYIVKSFTVSEGMTINVPANINLLDNDITLDRVDLTIKHGFGGLFAIESSGGKLKSSQNTQNLIINTPYAVYTYDNSMLDSVQVSNTYMGTLITSASLAGNSTLCQALLGDAITYIAKFIPAYIYDDLVLPLSYHNYGMKYSYAVSQGSPMTAGGNVTRGNDNAAGTVTVTAEYPGATSQSTQIGFTVVGSSETALRTAYRNVLSAYLTKNALSNNVLTYDADLVNLTERFNSDSGNTNSLTLTAGGEAKFLIRLSDDASISNITYTYIEGSAIANSELSQTVPPLNNALSASEHECSSMTFSYETNAWYLSYTFPVTAEITTTDGENTVTESVTENVTAKVKLTDVEVAYLRHNDIVMNDTQSTVTVDGADEISFTVAGMTRIETNAYINRTVGLYYFLDTTAGNNSRPLMTLTNGTLAYDGVTLSGGVASIDYNIYYVNAEDYERYLLGSMTLDALKATHSATAETNINTSFSLDTQTNGVINYNSVFNESASKLLLLIGDITYTDDSVYSVVREIMLPSIGEFDSERFTTGRTFADFISGMADDNYKLIESNENSHYTFRTGDTTMQVELDITAVNGETPDDSKDIDFCQIIECKHTPEQTVADDYSYLNIIPSQIPAQDSLIELTATFYAVSGETVNEYSKQIYSFTIPGIYHYNPDGGDNVIKDIWVYMRMLEVYGDFQGYLLTSDAKADKKLFECTEARLAALAGNTSVENPSGNIINPAYVVSCGIVTDTPVYTANETHSLEGVQYLTGTEKMSFDGVRVESLNPFGAYSGGSLTELSMACCSITQEKLNGSGNYLRPLYALDRLTTLTLDNNGITSLVDNTGEPCIYRNVTNLALNSQAALADITGIEKIPYIVTLSIKDNKIENFAPLLGLDKLEAVYLSGNTYNGSEAYTDGSNNPITMYGTSGQVNVPNYVALLHKKVSVYITVDTENDLCLIVPDNTAGITLVTAGGRYINQTMEYLAVSLNSIIIPDDYWTVSEKPTYLGEYTASGTSLTFTSIPTHTVGSRSHWIVSVSKDSTTVYKEFFYTQH